MHACWTIQAGRGSRTRLGTCRRCRPTSISLDPAPPALDEKEATQQGCELLGEGFVLSVGLALLLIRQLKIVRMRRPTRRKSKRRGARCST